MQAGNNAVTLLLSYCGARVPPQHEAGPEKREYDFAALVGAGVADLDDAPFRARGRRAQALDLADEADGVAGHYRLDPARGAKARRWPARNDRLAARDGFAHEPLKARDHQLHADG